MTRMELIMESQCPGPRGYPEYVRHYSQRISTESGRRIEIQDLINEPIRSEQFHHDYQQRFNRYSLSPPLPLPLPLPQQHQQHLMYFRCTWEGCTKVFSSRSNLARHGRIHINEIKKKRMGENIILKTDFSFSYPPKIDPSSARRSKKTANTFLDLSSARRSKKTANTFIVYRGENADRRKPKYKKTTALNTLNNWIERKINDKDINWFEFSEFKILETIGEGGFGTVYKAEWDQRGMEVAALKSLKNNSQTDENKIKEFIRELKSIRNLYYHTNINRFYGITKDELGNYLMVLQYANQGNLRKYLGNKEIFDSLQWEHKIQMALDITSGLKCLHKENIIHRDLHSKNILVNNDILMIADFGLSKRLTEITSNSLWGGMAAYIDPQCYKNDNYKRNVKSDIYSLGVLLWELISGIPPFQHHTEHAITIKIYNGEREQPVEGTLPEYQQLYQKCWDEDPKLRPDIDQVYEILRQIYKQS